MGNENANVTTLLVVANIFHTLKITKISVPELVQCGTNPVTLDCEFSAYEPEFILQWQHNGEKVYEWASYGEPQVFGLLEGKLDLGYKVTTEPWYSRRALRILDPGPELSGVYTCAITAKDPPTFDARNATMLVFSPEQEFSVSVGADEDGNGTLVNCTASGVFPQPTLELEINQQPIPQQASRIWRSGGATFYAQSSAVLPPGGVPRRVTCRLLLPQAGYMAIREVYCHDSSGNRTLSSLLLLVAASIVPPLLFIFAHERNIHRFI